MIPFYTCIDQINEINENHEINYEIKSEDECKNAALSLGLEWGNSYSKDGDFPACYYAQDARNKVFVNLSPNPSRENLNANYSAICKNWREGSKLNK